MVGAVRCVWRARVRAVCARVFRTFGSVVHKSTVRETWRLTGEAGFAAMADKTLSLFKRRIHTEVIGVK